MQLHARGEFSQSSSRLYLSSAGHQWWAHGWRLTTQTGSSGTQLRGRERLASSGTIYSIWVTVFSSNSLWQWQSGMFIFHLCLDFLSRGRHYSKRGSEALIFLRFSRENYDKEWPFKTDFRRQSWEEPMRPRIQLSRNVFPLLENGGLYHTGRGWRPHRIDHSSHPAYN